MSAPAEGRTPSLNPACTDKGDDDSRWSCIEFDGTGLWCDSCLAVGKATEGLTVSAPARVQTGEDR